MESSEGGGPSRADIGQAQAVKDPGIQSSKADIAATRQQTAKETGLQRLANIRERLSGFDSIPTKPAPNILPNNPNVINMVPDEGGRYVVANLDPPLPSGNTGGERKQSVTDAARRSVSSSNLPSRSEQNPSRNRPGAPESREVRASPDVIERVKELATQVEDIIRVTYGISNEGLARVADSFWNRGDNELRELLAKYGGDLNPRGANYVLDEKSWHSSIVYLAPDLIERLAALSSAEFLSDPTLRHDFATLIEEVSHFTYDAYYRKLYGVKPHSALVEMVAVLDEYNVFQYLTRLTQGKALSTQEHLDTLRYNEAVYNQKMRGKRPGAYIIGHEMGVQFLGYLNNLHNQGQNPGHELSQFYNESNRRQIEHLFYDLGFKVNTYSEQEKAEVEKVYRELK